MRIRIWLVLHAIVVLLPVLGAVAKLPDMPLYGVELPTDLPPLSFEGWRTEKVQPAFQSWFESHIGFRGVMIRNDNSIQVAALREMKPNSFAVIGNDDIFFSSDDMKYLGTQRRDMPAILARVAELTKRLGSVHRKMTARGKTLAVVLSPSKTDIYPESVPSQWRRGPDITEEIHEALRRGLVESGVPFGDGHAIFARMPKSERPVIFAQQGRHWTLVGACLALHDALEGRSPSRSCEYDMREVQKLTNLDFDLFRLQNNWGCDVGRAAVPWPRDLPKEDDHDGIPQKKPRALFAGTSFIWMLVHNLRPLVADKPIALFYNTTFFDLDSWTRIGSVDPTTPAWVEYVLERDLIVVDILETFAHHDEMFNFVTELDKRLGE
jgi:hypothetical protein